MPPRRGQRRRPPRRRNPRGAPNENDSRERAVDAAAQVLVNRHNVAELRSLVDRSREAFEWADQQARLDPSPQALLRFRSSERTLHEAERALHLLQDE